MKRSWFVGAGVLLIVILFGCAGTYSKSHPSAIPNMGGPPGECGKIAGQVVATDTDQPLRGAMVYVNGKFITSTNPDGEYFIFGVKHGMYRVSIVAYGYTDFHVDGVQVNTDLTTLVDTRMIRQ
jgi:hypothetical protein